MDIPEEFRDNPSLVLPPGTQLQCLDGPATGHGRLPVGFRAVMSWVDVSGLTVQELLDGMHEVHTPGEGYSHMQVCGRGSLHMPPPWGGGFRISLPRNN